MGVLFSIIAGAIMSLQGVINTGLSKKIGLYESNMFVQGTAFIFSLIAVVFLGRGSFSGLMDISKIYWIGGFLGLVITITVMLSISNLGPATAVLIILISQLIIASLIEYFGLFNTDRLIFHWSHYLGLALMITGVVLFKWNFQK